MVAQGDFVGAVSPVHVLGLFEGIPVMFVTAEVWTHALFIRLCAAQNERTQALDMEYEREFEQFTRELRAARTPGDAVRPDPPEQPGAVLNRIPLVVTDDVGTAYRSNGRSAAGTGTAWRGEWCLEPGVPADARLLTVRLDVPGGSRLACDVAVQALAEPSLPQ
jgi:hypothetical protein